MGRKVTTFLKTSNIGLNTKLELGNSNHGLKVQKENLLEDWLNHKPLMKPMECMLKSKNLKILENAAGAANKMTTHVDADEEVKGLKERYDKVKGIADEWVKKVDTLVKEWKLLDNTVNELNSWVATDRGAETEQNFSLEKMESTLGELKNIFKEKEKLVDNL